MTLLSEDETRDWFPCEWCGTTDKAICCVNALGQPLCVDCGRKCCLDCGHALATPVHQEQCSKKSLIPPVGTTNVSGYYRREA